MSKYFTNTGNLIISILRRDRIRIAVWLVSISLFTIMVAALLPDLYTSPSERQIMAETMKNPAITVMLGPGYGLDNYRDGAMMAHFMLVFTALASGIMGILLTSRHTREDEEEGRIEMIRALPVGNLSPLASTFLVVSLANILMSVATGLGLYALGFESMNFEGSMLYGASIGAIGICFCAITGLFAQLTSNNRATIGYSFAFLIFFYMLRAIGDVGYEILSLISPLGLILRTEVFVNNYWWPVFVTLALSTLIFILSLYLNSIRDLGSGFVSTRSGKEKASNFLLSPLGLAFRLQRTSIIAWFFGVFILGMSYGSILGDLEGFIESSDLLGQMLPQSEAYSMTERFVSMLITIMSIIGAIPPIIFLLKLKSEENKERTGHLLSRAVSRNSLLGSYTLISLVSAIFIQLLSVIGLWSAAIFVMNDSISLSLLLKAGLLHLPAMGVFIGLAVFLIGIAPKLTGLTWLYLGYAFFIGYMGDMLQLPEWMSKLSPFGHIPQVPVDDINIITLIILVFISIVLMAAGSLAYNKRDIEG